MSEKRLWVQGFLNSRLFYQSAPVGNVFVAHRATATENRCALSSLIERRLQAGLCDLCDLKAWSLFRIRCSCGEKLVGKELCAGFYGLLGAGVCFGRRASCP